MKTLLVLTLVLTTISLNPAVADTISIEQQTETDSQVETKGRNKQKENSARLYVNSKVTPNGVHSRYLILSANGFAIRTKAGNLSKIKKNINRRNLGQYRRQGNKLFIRWSDGKTWNLTAYRNGWSTGRTRKSHRNTFYPPIPVKGRLNGRYVAFSIRTVGFIGGPAPTVTAYNKNTFIFDSNGRFSHSGNSGASYNNAGRISGGPVGTAKSADSGIYNLRGYSLNLKYNNGKTLNHTAFKLPGWNDALMIDGRVFQLKK